MLYYIALYCIILYYFILLFYYIILYYIILYYIILYYIILYYIILYYIILYYIILYYIILYCIVLFYIELHFAKVYFTILHLGFQGTAWCSILYYNWVGLIVDFWKLRASPEPGPAPGGRRRLRPDAAAARSPGDVETVGQRGKKFASSNRCSLYAYTHMEMSINKQISTYLCMYICMYIQRKHACMHVCMHIQCKPFCSLCTIMVSRATR